MVFPPSHQNRSAKRLRRAAKTAKKNDNPAHKVMVARFFDAPLIDLTISNRVILGSVHREDA